MFFFNLDLTKDYEICKQRENAFHPLYFVNDKIKLISL